MLQTKPFIRDRILLHYNYARQISIQFQIALQTEYLFHAER